MQWDIKFRRSGLCVEGGVLGGVGLGIKTIPSIHHWSQSGRPGSAATCGKNL